LRNNQWRGVKVNFPLRILAGKSALADLRERGLRPSDVEVLVAPAGGTKFLALVGLDRVLFSALTAANLERVLAASAAVPLLVPGVTVPGGPAGIHRDAALLDYHPVLSLPRARGLVLYPHFFEHFTPGWFDRRLPHRRLRGDGFDRTVVLAPSASFVARLPGGRMPSRRDAKRFAAAERRRRWRAVHRLGAELGEALGEYLASPALVAKRAVALGARS
jgi:hypothetical protein